LPDTVTELVGRERLGQQVGILVHPVTSDRPLVEMARDKENR
jgi:hypothetical protein